MSADDSMDTSEAEARELSADQVAALARGARPSDWLIAADPDPAPAPLHERLLDEAEAAPRLAPTAFRAPEPGTPWWQTAKDCGAWTDRQDGDLGYIHFGSTEALRVYTMRIAEQARAALATQPAPPSQSQKIPAEIEAIIERLHTQDNRITDNPLFAVQQKLRVYGLDEDYEDAHGWANPDRDSLVLEGEPEYAELKAAWESGEEPQGDWRRVGFKDTWEFVTGCLTEQGCKDYIARNGHNLHEPRIYAYGSYRNAEFIALRKWLMSLLPAPTSAEQPHDGPKAEESAES